MSTHKPVYRQAALDKLSSPEELDRLMRITRPSAWLLLAALGGVLIMAVLWGVFGRIITTLEQPGLLTTSPPVEFVPAPEPGQVAALLVQPGDTVEAGQALARLSPADAEADPVTVTSPTSGRVIALRTTPGEPVDAGTPLLSLAAYDPDALRQVVIAFVPLEDRQRLKVGMEVQVLPATVEAETYGYLGGRVASVAGFAATREELLAALGDPGYADELAASGPVFEVRVALETGDDGAFVWSASDGPDFDLVSGTPCLLKIEMDAERPISRVFNLAVSLSGRAP